MSKTSLPTSVQGTVPRPTRGANRPSYVTRQRRIARHSNRLTAPAAAGQRGETERRDRRVRAAATPTPLLLAGARVSRQRLTRMGDGGGKSGVFGFWRDRVGFLWGFSWVLDLVEFF